MISEEQHDLTKDLLIPIENCGGFAGSHLQFGGVHVKIVYILRPIDRFPCCDFDLSKSSCVESGVEFVSRSVPGSISPPFFRAGDDGITV